VTSVLHPQFGRHEQLFARDAGILDSLPNGRLLHVRSGGINQAIPGVNGVDDAARTLLTVRNLEDAIANDWNGDAIVQRHSLHSRLLKQSDDRDHELVRSNVDASAAALHDTRRRRLHAELGSSRSRKAHTRKTF